MIEFLKLPWRKPESKPAPSIPLASPVLTELTLRRWFETSSNTTTLREAFKAYPILKEALGVVWSQMPRSFPPQGVEVSPTKAAIELGRTTGYAEALAVFQQLLEYRDLNKPAVPMDYPKTVEETYSPSRK